MPQNVVLQGPAPWGFRLSGGIDFNQPLIVTRITPGSKASAANLCPGDVIVAIDGLSTENMTHNEAQERIKAAAHQLCLKIERAGTKLWSPQVSEDGKAHPFKINLEAEPQEFKPIGTAHNRRAQPFVAAANIDDKRQVVSSSYNSPIGLYSSGNIQDALHGQLRGLIPYSPQKKWSYTNSPLNQKVFYTQQELPGTALYYKTGKFFQVYTESLTWKELNTIPTCRLEPPQLRTVMVVKYKTRTVCLGLHYCSGCSTPSGIDCGSGRSTPSSISTVSSICPTELKAVSKMAPNIPLEMELPGVKIVHAQFNTPMQLYSDDNIMETLQGQVSTALGETPIISDLSPNSVSQSDVYKMLHANQEEPSQPRQSGSFKVLQNLVSEEDGRPAGTRSVKAPVTKMPTAMPGVQKVPLCDKCGSGILGTVVKARDKYRHPECFVCSDCDLNLKQKGYFFVEGQLYCEAHARARMRPPEGYEAVTVYPKC